jgi:hypothetical protein
MNIKDKFLAFIDAFEGLGKEVLAFACLAIGLPLLIKGLINGAQFVDLVRGVAIAYITGATVGGTSDAILQHMKDMATSLVKIKMEKKDGMNES